LIDAKATTFARSGLSSLCTVSVDMQRTVAVSLQREIRPLAGVTITDCKPCAFNCYTV